MSNHLVIAAVTATLRKVILDTLSPLVPGIDVTTLPLDEVRQNNANGSQVNIYLYQTEVNAGWRNQDLPNRVRPGELGFPPLALNLFYLVTAYGQNNDEVRAHGLLGGAMSALHDMPVLDPADLASVLTPPDEPGEQIERVRITYEPLALDEISKIWSAFQTNYRISAAYQASVVLIDSLRPSKAGLPVLRRGQNDDGVTTLTAFPVLESVQVEGQRFGLYPLAVPGSTLILRGKGMQASSLLVRLDNLRLPTPFELPPVSVSESEVRVQIPNSAPDWPPGYYNASLVMRSPMSTNVLFASEARQFALIPTITSFAPNPSPIVGGEATLNVNFTPEVWPEQNVALMVGDREVLAPAHPAKTAALTFTVPQAVAGQYFLRLRVDSADSSLLDPNPALNIPQFDMSLQVTLT